MHNRAHERDTIVELAKGRQLALATPHTCCIYLIVQCHVIQEQTRFWMRIGLFHSMTIQSCKNSFVYPVHRYMSTVCTICACYKSPLYYYRNVQSVMITLVIVETLYLSQKGTICVFIIIIHALRDSCSCYEWAALCVPDHACSDHVYHDTRIT